MAEYTLYIDGSETFNNTGNKYFVMSGVIIRDSDYLETRKETQGKTLLTFNPISSILFFKQGDYGVVEKVKPDPLNLLVNTNVGS